MVWYKIVKKLVFRVVWGFHRRTAEGSPKGRRKRILADINARPPDEREPGNCRDRIATHSGRDGAGQEKKRKSPPRKKPPTKKEKPLLAAPLAYGRLRRPTPSASLPLLRRLRRLTLLPSLSWAAGAAPSLPSLFPLYQTINKPLTPSHVMNLSVLHLTSLPLVTLKGRYRKPLAFFIFCHNCLNV